jgi:hypothetical protein
MAKGDIHPETFAEHRPPAQTRHLRCGTSLIYKEQPVRLDTHARLAQSEPLIALLRDVRAGLLARH